MKARQQRSRHPFRRLSLINIHPVLLKLLHHWQMVSVPDPFFSAPLARVKKKGSGYVRLARPLLLVVL